MFSNTDDCKVKMLTSEKILKMLCVLHYQIFAPKFILCVKISKHSHLIGNFGLAFSGKVHKYAKELLKDNFPRDLPVHI